MSYESDRDFLRQHVEVVELRDPAGEARAAIVPAWQARVMTSTASGDRGASFGWINRDLVASRTVRPHINAFGGEDRFWLGPEGGPFSIFFAPGTEQTLANWQTPAAIDTEPFDATGVTDQQAAFTRTFSITNTAGTRFEVRADRTVRLIDPAEALAPFGIAGSSGVKLVACESENRITNIGSAPWTRQSGTLSIWMLGMFNPGDRATIVVPFQRGDERERGPIVNDSYFGKVPAERLRIDLAAGVIYFRGDGRHRGKIGLSTRRAQPVLGSYDPDGRALTLVTCTLPDNARDLPYVDSTWGDQSDPFGGDVVNSYNDGPPTPGAAALGPFYELETSSAAALLSPGESLVHVHRTIHVQADDTSLDPIARAALGVGVDAIRQGL